MKKILLLYAIIIAASICYAKNQKIYHSTLNEVQVKDSVFFNNIESILDAKSIDRTAFVRLTFNKDTDTLFRNFNDSVCMTKNFYITVYLYYYNTDDYMKEDSLDELSVKYFLETKKYKYFLPKDVPDIISLTDNKRVISYKQSDFTKTLLSITSGPILIKRHKSGIMEVVPDSSMMYYYLRE